MFSQTDDKLATTERTKVIAERKSGALVCFVSRRQLI